MPHGKPITTQWRHRPYIDLTPDFSSYTPKKIQAFPLPSIHYFIDSLSLTPQETIKLRSWINHYIANDTLAQLIFLRAKVYEELCNTTLYKGGLTLLMTNPLDILMYQTLPYKPTPNARVVDLHMRTDTTTVGEYLASL
jgi:hypothetical protein